MAEEGHPGQRWSAGTSLRELLGERGMLRQRLRPALQAVQDGVQREYLGLKLGCLPQHLQAGDACQELTCAPSADGRCR